MDFMKNIIHVPNYLGNPSEMNYNNFKTSVLELVLSLLLKSEQYSVLKRLIKSV